MNSEFESVFARLREILQKHAGNLSVKKDGPGCFALHAPAGAAALKAWGGKMKKPMIPIAWVQVGKGYVSYHLMGVYGNPKARESMSDELKRRMQGKSCFNFKAIDEALFQELDELTGQSIAWFKKSGFAGNTKTGAPLS